MPAEKIVIITIQAPESLKQVAIDKGKKLDLTLSQFIRKLIREAK